MSFFSAIFSRVSDNNKKVIASNAESELEEACLSKYQAHKQQGSELLNQGKFENAVLAFRNALKENPDSSEAHLNLGYALTEIQQNGAAKIHFERAAVLHPNNFDAHFLRAMVAISESDLNVALISLINALNIKPDSVEATSILYKTLATLGRFSEIEAYVKKSVVTSDSPTKINIRIADVFVKISCAGELKVTLMRLAMDQLQTAIKVDPTCVAAHNSQGNLWLSLNEPDLAIKTFEISIDLAPDCADAYNGLALAYRAKDDNDRGFLHAKKAIGLNPKYLDAHKLLGELYYESSDTKNAALHYKQVIEIDPAFPDGYIMLGAIHLEAGQFKEAFEYTYSAIKLREDAPEVHYALGNIYAAQNKFSDAVECYERSLRLRPNSVDVLNNLASAHLGLGNNAAALETYQIVARKDPKHAISRQNIAFCLTFDPNCSSASYLSNAQEFGKVIAARAQPYSSWKQEPLANRPLKVGLVSGDLRLHPVGLFLVNVLAYLDFEKIEIHAFSNLSADDAVQAHLRSHVSSWTAIHGLSDKAAAQVIYEANLDLLIDLSGHTGLNRLALFVWRPAPVQASWLGYWASTGLTEIDYVLADRYSVPPEHHDHFCEKVWYVADTRLCFTTPSAVYDMLPAVAPAVKKGFITFGCYQPIKKLTESVLVVWAGIFRQLPTARLRLQAASFTDPKVSNNIIERLERLGISKDRVSVHGSMPYYAYLHSHAEVDIILDSFPYPGGTTTCDSLWMGVPTLTLAGNTMLSRQGVSLLTCAGLEDWIAKSEEDYVRIAVKKAQDIDQISQLRADMRKQVFASPLFDAPSFARQLEDSFVGMAASKQG